MANDSHGVINVGRVYIIEFIYTAEIIVIEFENAIKYRLILLDVLYFLF